ncbi:BRO-N domain-containing protein [Pseudomonas koreensis]|uniref:Bro-N domain-containing protein n=1 Tax=Pseudomonas koreensis TaxID=198620 RepID=A0A9X2XF93_9PSED|nr:Bro-N domain-containing protein [Pseudomonas koreensis]MCU7247586.1 Bro-N domain-containing protein [Pseudomonas koreensis]
MPNQTQNFSKDCPYFIPTVFTRHNRFLHALLLDHQAWFCAQDLGRMMGHPLNPRVTLKLDHDQRCTVQLRKDGEVVETPMVSESGVYALLVHHFIPENRNLRQWLSNEVIPMLRETGSTPEQNGPSLSSVHWAGVTVPLLHRQQQAWIKWRDMPELMLAQRSS